MSPSAAKGWGRGFWETETGWGQGGTEDCQVLAEQTQLMGGCQKS